MFPSGVNNVKVQPSDIWTCCYGQGCNSECYYGSTVMITSPLKCVWRPAVPPSWVYHTGVHPAVPPSWVHHTGVHPAVPPRWVHHTGVHPAIPPSWVHHTGVQRRVQLILQTAHTVAVTRDVLIPSFPSPYQFLNLSIG